MRQPEARQREYITLFKALCLVSALFILPGFAQAANLLDTWMDQQTVTKPGVYKGSEYGYLTAGSYSSRTRLRGDPFFTLTPPKIQVGCGGIDIFMGSYGFVDQKFFETKLRRILAGAPAAAFELAFKALCASCADTMKSVNTWLDSMNSMQLDECKASKALVATIASPLSDNKQITEDIVSFQQSVAGNFWRDETEKIQAAGGVVTTAQIDGLLAGCPAQVRDVFGRSGSVLSHIGDKLGYPSGHMDFVRGLFGDIIIEKRDGYMVKFDPPCSANAALSLQRFISGHAEQKIVGIDGITTQCVEVKRTVNGVSDNLEAHSKMVMAAYQTKIKTKGALTPAEKASLETSGFPVSRIAQISVTTKLEDNLLEEFGRLWAMDRAYRMLGDVAAIAEEAFNLATMIQSTASEQPNSCKIHIMAGAMEGFSRLKDSSWKLHQSITREYGQAIAEAEQKISHLSTIGGFGKEKKAQIQGVMKAKMLR